MKTVVEEQVDLLRAVRSLEKEIAALCTKGDETSLRQALEKQTRARAYDERRQDIALIRRLAVKLQRKAVIR